MKNIRNFSIIAHIDHGKSTLADRLIETCNGLTRREMKSQVLDNMDIERERGITIKSQCVTLEYQYNNTNYTLNLIDTPGHVDFSYEVSRSLSACEGTILIVDASQGIEAQTLANYITAKKKGLKIIPVINKIDLPNARPEEVKKEMRSIMNIDPESIIEISAKTGFNIDKLLKEIINKIPCPESDDKPGLQALIIDSWFDKYLGVISLVKIFKGTIRKKEKIKIFSTQKTYIADKIGVFTPKRMEKDCLETGSVGFIVANIKNINGAPVGDTIISSKDYELGSLDGFKKVMPRVYASIFPSDSNDFRDFQLALKKLSLNDASLYYEAENSKILGFGFRCGFLGILHMEIVQERLEREYNLKLITTIPTVIYEVLNKKNQVVHIDNPTNLPEKQFLIEIREPIAKVNILSPKDFIGSIMILCEEKRGIQKGISYSEYQVSLEYEIPMNEIILNFFDKLKSITKGYASLDYSFLHYKKSDLVKLDVLINKKKVDILSYIISKDKSQHYANFLSKKIKELLPKQLIDISIQIAIGGNIISRSNVKALRKNVTDKCYGGDITRKRKLLEKQKKGKKRMKQIGSINIPQDVFLSLLKMD